MTVRKVARQEAKKVVNRAVETKIWEGNTSGIGIPRIGYNFICNYTYDGTFPVETGSMDQGIDAQDYIGDWITPVMLEIRYTVNTADAFNRIALRVFQAKGLFTVTESDAVGQWTGYNTPTAPLGFVPEDNKSRLRILATRIHNLNTQGQNTHTGVIRIKGKKLRRINLESDGSVRNGIIFISVISDSEFSTHPGFEARWRLYYKDG